MLDLNLPSNGYYAIYLRDYHSEDKDKIYWCIVEKKFFNKYGYIDSKDEIPEIPGFKTCVKQDCETYSCYIESIENISVEQQSEILKKMGFEIANGSYVKWSY